jgi:hypothetical protein
MARPNSEKPKQVYAYPENGLWVLAVYENGYSDREDFRLVKTEIPVKYTQIIDDESAEEDIDNAYSELGPYLHDIFNSKEEFDEA